MKKIDQYLYDNYICWETGVLVFNVANKNCHIQEIGRVDETTQKTGNFFGVIRRSQSPNLLFSNKNCSFRRGLNFQINKTCHIKIGTLSNED